MTGRIEAMEVRNGETLEEALQKVQKKKCLNNNSDMAERMEAMDKNGFVACVICSKAFDNHPDVLDHYSTMHQIKIHGCEGIFSPKVVEN